MARKASQRRLRRGALAAVVGGVVVPLAAWLILGGGRGNAGAGPATRPADGRQTASNTANPTTRPGDVAQADERPNAIVRVKKIDDPSRPADEKEPPLAFEFPPAKLVLQERDGKLAALLFSDDPRDAINRNWAGNSFYFDMDLGIATPDDLASADWEVQSSAAPDEHDESANGLYLRGDKVHLQPTAVRVLFEPVPDAPDEVVVILSGIFRWSEEGAATPNAKQDLFAVTSRMTAELSKGKAKK
jgi:hypothetical protein